MRRLLGPVLLLIVWASISYAGVVKPLFLPSPAAVISALVGLMSAQELWRDIGATAYRSLLAFSLSAFIGVLIGIPLGMFRRFYESAEVIFDFFRTMPSPALIPLAMLVFGIGDLSRVAVAAFTCALINGVQTAFAIRSLPNRRLQFARLVGARRFFLFRAVLLPSLLPGIMAGWRITLSLSLIIIVVSEMFIGTAVGLGTRIYDFQLMFRTAEMYACIGTVGMLGYVFSKAVELLEYRYVHWTGK